MLPTTLLEYFIFGTIGKKRVVKKATGARTFSKAMLHNSFYVSPSGIIKVYYVKYPLLPTRTFSQASHFIVLVLVRFGGWSFGLSGSIGFRFSEGFNNFTNGKDLQQVFEFLVYGFHFSVWHYPINHQNQQEGRTKCNYD